MAKRPTRRRIIDHLEASMRELDQAEQKLALVSAIYFEAGAKEGAVVDQIRDSIVTLRDTVKSFRYQWA